MRWRNPSVWLGVLSASAVVLFVVRDLTRTAPGPLTAVHGQVAKLTGLGSCAQCHGGWFGNMTESCLECHEPIATQIADGRGLHGSVGADRARRCATCHSEHHGAAFPIVNQQSFAQAGVLDAQAFDHALIGFAMEGKHLALECGKCHENADVEVLPEGQRRFLGLSRDCATCHEDPHKGRMQLACASCHGQVSFAQLEAPGHEEVLSLAGGHAHLDCRACHAENDDHSLENVGRTADRRAPRRCVQCHESPHRLDFVRGVAAQVDEPAGNACRVCHGNGHESFRAAGATVTPEQHATAGFPLAAPHADLTCDKCHAPDRPTFAERHPGRSADDCRQCHEDPHGGQFEGSPHAPRGCVDCHERTRFEPHGFSVEQHAKTAFALTDSHARTDCHGCHRPPADGQPRAFRGTGARCESCHDDAHDGFFERVTASLQPPAGQVGQCAHCHRPTHFTAASQGFDHARWTGFAVTGAHEQAGCESCHARTEKADATGRRFGRVAEQHGEFRGCVTCHVDPHGGVFDRSGLPRAIDGRTDCARCHVTVSFRKLRGGFEHGQWTGFALQGAHRRAACASCHEPRIEPDEHGCTWQPARGKACADCHADPHAGQFRQGARTDCARCHGSAESFAKLTFNHELHSRFKLGEAHREVPCADCHKPFAHGEAQITRYRPLNTQCSSCHGEQSTPFKRRKRLRR